MLIYLQMLGSPEEKSILEQIYLEYRGLMYHVAYEILHNEQDAEDAVHHAFVKIAENIKKITDPVCPKTHSYVVTITPFRGLHLLLLLLTNTLKVEQLQLYTQRAFC